MPKIDLNNPLIALHSIPRRISREKIILETSHAFFSDMTAKLLEDIGKYEPLKKIASASMEVVSAGGSIRPEKPKPEPDPKPNEPGKRGPKSRTPGGLRLPPRAPQPTA